MNPQKRQFTPQTCDSPGGSCLGRRRVALAFVSCLLVTFASAGEWVSIREIRNPGPDGIKAGTQVTIRGVVTYSKPSIATLFVQDATGGIFIEQQPGRDESGPKPGDRVEIRGVAGDGDFAPVVEPPPEGGPNVTVTGHGPLPEPRRIMADTLMIPDMDCEWVSIEALVREVQFNGGDLVLSCQSDARDFSVLLEGPLPPESVPWDLAESRVMIRGVVATTFNSGRQMTGRFLRVSSLDDIRPLTPQPLASGEPPLVTADHLLRSGGPGPADLVRVRGVASMALPGRGIFLQVEDGGLWVQTAQPVAVQPGTVIEVTGWPRPGEMKPFIRARRAAVIGTTTPPLAVPLKAADALKAEHDGEWVSVEAELLDFYQSPDGITLELRDEDMVFRGLIPIDATSAPPRLVPGSKLRITGVSRISSAGNFILRVEDKLLVLARSAKDVEVMAPPPLWTARNVAILATIMILGLLAAYAIARTRRKREQRTQRREFEAVLAERGRFAREIHDSLAQGLTSISLQLECVRDRIVDNPGAAAGHVEKARSLVRESLREARRTVWNLRPLALGEADLAGSLQRYAANLCGDGKVICRQEIEGTPRPLQPDHEATLLRIGQEALTNAIRHAGATEVRQRLRFGTDWVTLSIIDNGRGFDVSSMVGKGFGLTSMHERAATLGGSLSIDSRPGHGTEVSATLPT